MMTLNRIGVLCVLLLTAALVACGGKKITVEIPPQINLATLGTIGVVAFDVQSDEHLPGDITLKFIQHLQSAQPGVPILELGSQANVLREVGFGALDTDAVKTIGKKYGVDSLLTGTLEVTQSYPDVKVGQDLSSMSAAAYVRGNLNARLRQTRTGATVWSNGAHGKWKLAGLNLASGHLSSIGMSNIEDTYKEMLQELARVGTSDFRKSYETRKITE
jgi:Tfp pilus assembly protein PilW